MTDYLIVGCGLAGIAFAETALSQGKTVAVFDNASQASSKVAAGVYNPVILKRFSGLQHAQEQLDLMQSFYDSLEAKLGIVVNFPTPILRRFFSVEEQNNWFAASDRPGLKEFLSTDLVQKNYPYVQSPFGFGRVMQTGYIDTQNLLAGYRRYLVQEGLFSGSAFDHQSVVCYSDHVSYQNIKAQHIVFAEGFGVRHNPFFNHLPLNGTKGEVLLISAPDLRTDAIIKGNVFLLPMGHGIFKVGATYNWDDKSQNPTPQAREELQAKLAELIDCSYEILEQQAGIRPTVNDRKPLIGTHHEFRRLHILNGLGTRGVMLGPYCAKYLYNHIANGASLPAALDIKRFA